VKQKMLEADIWHAAQLMIETHGDQAELQAALKTEEMLEQGDPAGRDAWKKIMNAIIVLRVAAPSVADKAQ
jgi:hypothetical protein